GGAATGGASTGGAATGGAATGGAATGGAATGGAATGGAATGGAGTGGAATGGAGSGGSSPTLIPTVPGQLVISEIMVDTRATPDDLGEWFEIYNPSTTATYNLMGCAISDLGNGNTHTIGASLIVAPGAYVTLARTSDVTSMGFAPTYSYGMTLKFNNDAADSVRITCNSVTIDVVDFPLSAAGGQSRSLDPRHLSATDNDVQANWCLGISLYHATATGSDQGTPGAGNHPQCATAGP
ncbi:MAG: lamin tail domain-containing protein, partial [Pseudomonadota bacterium]